MRLLMFLSVHTHTQTLLLLLPAYICTHRHTIGITNYSHGKDEQKRGKADTAARLSLPLLETDPRVQRSKEEEAHYNANHSRSQPVAHRNDTDEKHVHHGGRKGWSRYKEDEVE